jgi:hypothetical protein
MPSMIRTALSLACLAAPLALLHADATAADKTLKLRSKQSSGAAVVARPDVLHGAATLPDFVIRMILPDPDPVEGLPNQGYCYKWPAGGPANRVLFAVRNQGNAPAPATNVQVFFHGAPSASIPLIPLGVGQQRDVEVPIPAGCYPPTAHGACEFDILVDWPGSIVESNEHNVVSSRCLLAGT